MTHTNSFGTVKKSPTSASRRVREEENPKSYPKTHKNPTLSISYGVAYDKEILVHLINPLAFIVTLYKITDCFYKQHQY
jgi:hypothetical protein